MSQKAKTNRKKEEIQPLSPTMKSLTQFSLAPIVGAALSPVAPTIAPLAGALMMANALTIPYSFINRKLLKEKRSLVSKERLEAIFESIGLKNSNGEKITVNLIEGFENYCDIYLQLPLGVSKEDVEKKVGAISTYYRNRCFILNARQESESEHKFNKLKDGFGVITLRLYTTKLDKQVDFKLISLTPKQKQDKLIFFYGKSSDGWEYVDLSEGHVLISGETGSGKSVLLHVILMQLMLNYTVDELEIEICDFKEGVEFGCYAECQHVTMYNSDYSSDVVKDYLQGLFEEMRERNELFKTIPGCTKISEYNRKCDPKKRIPRKLVVIEEMVTLMGDKEVKELFGQLSALARNAGIHLIGTTQRPSKDVISSLLKCNMAIRFGLLTADANNSRIIIDREGCENLRGKGNGLLKTGAVLTEFQSMYLKNDDIDKLLQYMKRGPHFSKRNWRTGEIETTQGQKLDELLGEAKKEMEEATVVQTPQPTQDFFDLLYKGE